MKYLQSIFNWYLVLKINIALCQASCKFYLRVFAPIHEIVSSVNFASVKKELNKLRIPKKSLITGVTKSIILFNELL